MFCKNCGANVNDGEMFCPACGVKQDVVETPAAPQQPVYNEAPSFQQAPAAPAAKKGFDLNALKELTKHKLFKPVAAVIAVLLVVCIVLVPVLGTVGAAKEVDFYLYATDKGELFVKYPKDKEGKEITDDLADEDMIYYVADKKLLFFVEDDDATLCYVNVSKKELKPEKVAKDVDDFAVSADGKTVWYESDGDLYVSDLKNKNKIESDVYSFFINEKGDKCTFFVRDEKAEDDLEAYDIFSTNKKGKVKEVVTEVSNCLGYSREEGVVFYQNREEIYSVAVGANKAKKVLAIENWSEESDIDICGVVSAKEFYYTIDETIDTMDFITDDHDAKADEEADWEDKEATARHYIRESFKEDTVSSTELHYVKGGKDKGVIATGVNGYPSFNSELGYLRFSAQTVNKDAKVNIDDLADAYVNYDYEDENSKSYYDVLNDSVYGEYSYNLVIDGKVNVIASAEDAEDLEVKDIRIDEKGKTLYYINEYDEEDNSGKLYSAKISGTKLKAAKELYSDVYSYGLTEKGNVVTLREYDEGTATLYVDKKEIEDDVYSWTVAQDGTIFYRTNFKDGSFTLMQLNGKKGVKIADDVRSFAALGKNDVMFIDEDFELFQYNKKDSKSIDDDVLGVMVLPSYNII